MGYSEYDNEPFGSIKSMDFFDQLREYKPFEKDSDPRTQVV